MALGGDHLAVLLAAPFVGSFLSVLVVRLPAAEPVAVSRSRCPACEHVLGPFDLLPLASWLLRGGRCRYCRGPISLFYPAIEIAAVAVALSAALVVEGWLLWVTCLLGWALLALAITDLREMMLPDSLTLPLLPAGLGTALWLDPAGLPDHLLGAIVGFGFLYGLNVVYRQLRGRDGLGLGDAKLLAAAGAWLGWQALPSMLVVATLAALGAVGVASLAGRRTAADTALPFGSFLCLGFWVTWLYAPLIAAIPPL
jgi:leader peptidase (prepilin peptidase) / N-methyltransferase